MEPLEFNEELAVRNDSTIQVGMIVSICNVQRQLPEGFRTKAQRPVNVPFRRCRFSGVRFIAIDEEYVPSGSYMPGTPIGVLLDAFLDKADYKMLVRMTCESVLDIMRMNDLGVIGTAEAINVNPLRSCCHRDQLSDEGLCYIPPF
jgi:hypothetical protein